MFSTKKVLLHTSNCGLHWYVGGVGDFRYSCTVTTELILSCFFFHKKCRTRSHVTALHHIPEGKGSWPEALFFKTAFGKKDVTDPEIGLIFWGLEWLYKDMRKNKAQLFDAIFTRVRDTAFYSDGGVGPCIIAMIKINLVLQGSKEIYPTCILISRTRPQSCRSLLIQTPWPWQKLH